MEIPQAYANNQHKIVQEMKANPFLSALGIVDGTVSILDTDAEVYRRIWCIYEFYVSVTKGNKYKFDIYTVYNLNGAVGIQQDVFEPKSHFPLDLVLKVFDIDVSKASATYKTDEKKLRI